MKKILERDYASCNNSASSLLDKISIDDMAFFVYSMLVVAGIAAIFKSLYWNKHYNRFK